MPADDSSKVTPGRFLGDVLRPRVARVTEDLAWLTGQLGEPARNLMNASGSTHPLRLGLPMVGMTLAAAREAFRQFDQALLEIAALEALPQPPLPAEPPRAAPVAAPTPEVSAAWRDLAVALSSRVADLEGRLVATTADQQQRGDAWRLLALGCARPDPALAALATSDLAKHATPVDCDILKAIEDALRRLAGSRRPHEGST